MKCQMTTRFHGFLPKFIIARCSFVGMIAIHEDQIVKSGPRCRRLRIAGQKLDLMGQVVFLERNLQEFIILRRNVDRGDDGILIAGYGK